MKVLTGTSLVALLMTAMICAAPVSAQQSANDKAESKASSDQAFLGVALTETHPVLQGHYSEVLGEAQGAMVRDVMKESPAAKAGLRKWDVLMRYNDQKLDSPRQLVEMVQKSQPGDTVTVSYLRGGQVNETQLTLGKKPGDWPQVTSPSNRPALGKGGFPFPGFDRDRFPRFDRDSFPGFDPDRFPGFDPDSFPGFDLKKFGIDLDNFSIPSDSLPSAWNSFQSMSITKQSDGTYELKLDMRDGDNNRIQREYTGTRDDLRKAVEEDKELSEQTRELILRSLDKGGSVQMDWPWQKKQQDDSRTSKPLEF